MTRIRIAILAGLVIGVLTARALVLARFAPARAPQSDAPTLTSISFTEGTAQAAKEAKLLVVDAMAQWCGPCKRMERDSWTDPSVESWMHDHAVFVQIDVDQDQDLSRELKIEAMPTIIVFKDGKELGRSVGYLNAWELRNWLSSN